MTGACRHWFPQWSRRSLGLHPGGLFNYVLLTGAWGTPSELGGVVISGWLNTLERSSARHYAPRVGGSDEVANCSLCRSRSDRAWLGLYWWRLFRGGGAGRAAL